MASVKYRQRLPGGKWKSYSTPAGFLKNAEFYTDIIKNYDETPHLAVYHIGVCRNSADDRYFNHVTKRFKLVYVLEGNGWFNGIPVKSGQGFLMRKDHVNSMSADIRSPWRFIYVSFSGSLAEDLLLRAGFTEEDTIFDVSNIGHVRSICFDAVYAPDPERVTELYLLSILFELLSYVGKVHEGAKVSGVKQSSDMNPHVLKAVAFMSKNYRAQITVTDIAAAAHISEKYMRELFKNETGRSMKAYLTDLRLSAAKTLLSNSKYNVTEVANLSGFPEYRNFVRVFKERFGKTPTEYRTGTGE
jgi:AraC-like DNA-binding protein